MTGENKLTRFHKLEKNGKFSNFHFPNACKIELHVLNEAGTFIKVDSEVCWLPAYFENPVIVTLVLEFVSALFFKVRIRPTVRVRVCLHQG